MTSRNGETRMTKGVPSRTRAPCHSEERQRRRIWPRRRSACAEPTDVGTRFFVAVAPLNDMLALDEPSVVTHTRCRVTRSIYFPARRGSEGSSSSDQGSSLPRRAERKERATNASTAPSHHFAFKSYANRLFWSRTYSRPWAITRCDHALLGVRSGVTKRPFSSWWSGPASSRTISPVFSSRR